MTAYDPYGTGRRGAQRRAPYATDNNAGTYWETERYSRRFAELGKRGVGLVLDASAPSQLHQLDDRHRDAGLHGRDPGR